MHIAYKYRLLFLSSTEYAIKSMNAQTLEDDEDIIDNSYEVTCRLV